MKEMSNNDSTMSAPQWHHDQGMRMAEQPMEVTLGSTPQPLQAQPQQSLQAQALQCPYCGATNDADSLYCHSCGQVLHKLLCPNCGSEMDADADFCESCHHYVRHDVCSFCGASLSAQDAFCPECGSPRGGIVCPTCHTLNEFAFCRQCGRALTDDASRMVEELKKHPDYLELVEAASELDELQMHMPYEDDSDMVSAHLCDELRQRVLRLLAQDAGVPNVVIPPLEQKRLTKNELDERKKQLNAKIAELLDKMALPPQPQPAAVRNYAMAQKPIGVRLAWRCNYKQALHSSPCGCAKPQMGGKWIVLGVGQQEIKDDK